VVGYSQIISEIQAEQSRLLALFLVLALFVGYLGQGFSKILLASHTQFVTNPSHRSPEERLELARATPLGWVQEIDEVISQLASYERTAMNSMEEEASRYAVTKILADKLAQFVATANVPIFSIDPDGLVLEWNAKAEELTGFGSDQVVTRPLAERLVQDGKSREVVTSALRQAVSGVPVANISAKFRTSSGAQIRFFLNVSPNYDEYGDITGASLVAQDVTLLSDERDKLDKLATAKTELLQAILALNSDGVIAIGANGFIEHANDVIIQLLGVPESDVLGKTEDWFNDQLRQKLIASQNAGILESADEKSIELYLNSPEPHVLERAVKVQSDPDGRLIRKVMYFRDVTVAKEVQRLKTEFLTNAAHELRTPLASIFGFSELLMSRSFDQESGKNIIATIHRQSGVMVSLINDILNLSRLENRQSADTVFTEQDLKPAVFEAIESMDVRDDDRKVIVDVPDDIFLVSYDKKKMVLALNHLLENAYKFSPLGGDILVTVSSLSRNTRDYVCVQVKDEGVGMSKIELQHIFDRFYKIEAAETDPGSGLGLALVKEIVRIHSGEIDVVSTPGLGTSFNMYFPLAGKVSAKDNEIPGNN